MCPCAHKHTTTLYKCNQAHLYVQSSALCQGPDVTFLGHISPLPFICHYLRRTHFSVPRLTLLHATATPLFPFQLFFFYFFSLRPISPIFPFSHFFSYEKQYVGSFPHTDCLCVGFLCLTRGWVSFGCCFATLGFGSAHQVFDKRLELVCTMPRA